MKSPKLEGTIAGRIYRLRRPDETKPAVFTQAEMGKLLDVTGNTVDKWEHGRTQPSLEMIGKIAKLFNTSCDFIITGIETSNKTLVDELGLSNASIERLKSKESKLFGTEAKAINLLLLPSFSKILHSIYRYMSTDYRKGKAINNKVGLDIIPRMVFPPLVTLDKDGRGDVLEMVLLDEEEQGYMFDKAELAGLMNEINKAKEEVYNKALPVAAQFVEEEKSDG